MAMAGCKSTAICDAFLNFEPTEMPPWRRVLPDCDKIPSIKQMMQDILNYKDIYNRLTVEADPAQVKKVQRHLLISFLLSVQKGEQIGVCERGKTEELMEAAEKQSPMKRKVNNENEPPNKQAKCPESQSEYEECIGSLEEEIAETYEDYQDGEATLDKSMKETLNLCRAYLHLQYELHLAQVQQGIQDKYETTSFSYIGLIELESCIQGAHYIAMKEIVPPNKAGKFSTSAREATFKGQKHVYPHFTTTAVADEAILALVDKYNDMVEEIKNVVNEVDKLLLSFKCATLFLFGFLTLHPFSDGNGRIARLLASYSLLTFSPFMTPIYNVFSSSCEKDYVEALVAARSGLKLSPEIDTVQGARCAAIEVLRHKPEDLCAMLIESNWTMWRQCLTRLGHTLQLFNWESDRMVES